LEEHGGSDGGIAEMRELRVIPKRERDYSRFRDKDSSIAPNNRKS
jgi:hypothetical protein